MDLPRRLTPEEKELAVKREQLEELEQQLVERELELETLRGGLLAFEKKYQAATLERYALLDELRARIVELQASRAPENDTAVRAAAAESRARAEKTAAAARAKVTAAPPKPAVGARRPGGNRPTSQSPKPSPSPDFNPTETLKRLYRDVAKSLHPDLADDESERETRHAFMIRANEAYEQESEQRLADLLHEWHCAPEAVKGQGPAAELIRAIRKIHRCEERLMAINLEMDKLQTAGIFGMKMIAEEAEQFERDFLTEMTGRLDAEIEGAKALLLRLGGTLPPPQLTGPPEPEAQPAPRIE
jgi:hypothetical protein